MVKRSTSPARSATHQQRMDHEEEKPKEQHRAKLGNDFAGRKAGHGEQAEDGGQDGGENPPIIHRDKASANRASTSILTPGARSWMTESRWMIKTQHQFISSR